MFTFFFVFSFVQCDCASNSNTFQFGLFRLFCAESNLERKKKEKKLDLVLVMDGSPSVVG